MLIITTLSFDGTENCIVETLDSYGEVA